MASARGWRIRKPHLTSGRSTWWEQGTMGISSGEFVSIPYGKLPGRETEWLGAPVIPEVCDCRHKLSRPEQEPGSDESNYQTHLVRLTRGQRPHLIVNLCLSACDLWDADRATWKQIRLCSFEMFLYNPSKDAPRFSAYDHDLLSGSVLCPHPSL